MTASIKPKSRAGLSATISDIPGDKSMSHRAIIIGSLAEGRSVIRNFLCADDCLNTAKVFQNLGVAIEINKAEKTVVIDGVGLYGLQQPDKPLDVGNAGTGIRLITGVLAGQEFDTVITGDESIQGRPMKRVIDPLKKMGASIIGQQIDGKSDLYPPLTILGGKHIQGSHHVLSVASAQVKSAILLAGLYANGPTTVLEPSPPSRDHTEKCIARYGGKISVVGLSRTVVPGPLYAPSTDVHIPSDFSSAAFFIVLGCLFKNTELKLSGISLNPTRSALLDQLIDMGANITVTQDSPDDDGEAYGTILVKTSQLKNKDIPEARLPFLIDEIPILAIAGAFADGQMRLRNAEELRVKESDRISAIFELMRALGGQIKEYDDGFDLMGGIRESDAPIDYDAGHDHRMAMSAIIAAILLNRPATIKGAEYIATSFPTFNDILKNLNVIH